MPSDLMCSDRSKCSRPNGFSLVECLMVVALLGILATLAIPSSSAVQRRLDDAAAGVLFGDSEDNMRALSEAAPTVLHQLSRVHGELGRIGRLACAAERAAACGGQGGRPAG